MDNPTYKYYRKDQCVTFLKTNEQFGGLSNMAGGYPLIINNIKILTSEALYQACRFPHLPEVQKIIIGQNSPMTAKMKSKSYRKDSRTDWDAIRIDVMRWCLRVKLAQHWEKFGELLLSTGEKPIVEVSYRDQFWGAKPIDEETLAGANVLGRLLTWLRKQLREMEIQDLLTVKPLPISDFFLMSMPIALVEGDTPKSVSMSLPLDPVQLASDVVSLVNEMEAAATEQIITEEVERKMKQVPIFEAVESPIFSHSMRQLTLDGGSIPPHKEKTTSRAKKSRK